MAKVVLDFGTTVDMLNKDELQEALAEDARLRALVTGVKPFEVFLNSAQITALTPPGATANVITTSGGMFQAPASGYVWAVMLTGWEVSGAGTNVRLYKGSWANASATANGTGRLVASNTGTPNAASFLFSKGQLMMKAGDQLTFVCVTAAQTLLGIYYAGIEIPAERVGELLL